MPLAVVKSNDPLAELERRHDDVLHQLDELDRRIEQALSDFCAVQQETANRFEPIQKAAA